MDHFVVFALSSLVFMTLITAESQQLDTTVKFSRLLNQKPELLRYTSISSSPTPSKEFRKGVAIKKPQAEAPVDDLLEINRPPNYEREYLHGEPVVQVQHSVREESSSPLKEGTLTTINQKPISGRIPVTVLRQSSGNNRLNISPVFAEQDRSGSRRRPLVENVTEKEEDLRSEEPEVTTLNTNYDDEDEFITTEKGIADEILIPIIPKKKKPEATPVPTVQQEIVQTTAIIFDNTSTTPTTTPIPLPVASTTTENLDEIYKENFIAESFSRKGQFPDFEDSPGHLITAESNQPARVNVRPASSGKDYEYEYIYYYYDDDDEDNSTSTTKAPIDGVAAVSSLTPSDAPKIEADVSHIEENFAAEKIQKVAPPSNSLDQTRESKNLQYDYDLPISQDTPIGDYLEEKPITEEPLKIQKPSRAERPIVLKQSNLTPAYVPTTTSEVPPPPPSSTTTEPPTSTSDIPVSRQAGSRFRGKDRSDTLKHNKFAAPVQIITEAPSPSTEEPIVSRRPVYKESSRRNPTRRPVQTLQVEEPSTTEKLKVKATQLSEPKPSRTRFPPRVNPTTASNEVADVVPIKEAATPQLSTLQPNSIQADDKKAKENYARTKSINDLYALTRLHQLAINTRIPNRKSDPSPSPSYKGTPPKIAGGFLNSAEVTTQDDHTASETTTITSFIPASHVASRVSSTTEQASTSSTTSAATEEHFGGKRNRGFRGRQRPTQSSSTSTETPVSRPSNPSRFGGRRRTFTPSEAPSSVAPVEGGIEQPAVASSVAPPSLRQRNRFAGRTRHPTGTTSTTEASETSQGSNQAAAVEEPTQSPLPRKQRPGGFGGNRKRPANILRDHRPVHADNVEASQAPAQSHDAPASPPETERRPLGLRNSQRNRKLNGVGGAGSVPVPGSGPGPIVGRPLRLRKTTTTTTEFPEPAVIPQENSELAIEQSPTVLTELVDSSIPVSPKVTVLSSTTIVETPVEPTQLPKRGSVAALGRLRPRTKPAALPTTAAPEVTTVARKPSRLSGILNRKKPTPAPTQAPVQTEEKEDNGQEQDEPLPKGVIVQVSTIVSQSEETPDHVGEIVDDHASTTQSSILNRLKTQRKPGSLFRKRVE